MGFCATFGAKWFGGYARVVKTDKVTPRNMSNEAIRNLEKQRRDLQGIKFIYRSFKDYSEIKNAVIYCDIPYRSTTKYNDDFPHDEFYEWCRKMNKNNNTILVSEYNMPEDFYCIWKMEHKTIVSKDVKHRGVRVEKLYVLK